MRQKERGDYGSNTQLHMQHIQTQIKNTQTVHQETNGKE